jgi:hypothetical protein
VLAIVRTPGSSAQVRNSVVWLSTILFIGAQPGCGSSVPTRYRGWN